jgi:D-glycero-alpha-D-manno-heptose 1-phosphate guanylyltransferase
MQAIILAGGFGSRLRSEVSDVAKPMAPIGDRPFLEILLLKLASQNIRHVVLSVGYLADSIKDYFGSHFSGMSISYCLESYPLGTGGAIKTCLEDSPSELSLVLNGDSFLDFNLTSMLAFYNKHSSLVLAGKFMDDISRYGAMVTDENKRLIAFKEKGEVSPGLINAGCYLIGQDLFHSYKLPTSFSFESDFLSPNLFMLNAHVFCCDGQFIDIGIPEDFKRAQNFPFFVS